METLKEALQIAAEAVAEAELRVESETLPSVAVPSSTKDTQDTYSGAKADFYDETGYAYEEAEAGDAYGEEAGSASDVNEETKDNRYDHVSDEYSTKQAATDRPDPADASSVKQENAVDEADAQEQREIETTASVVVDEFQDAVEHPL